MSASRSISSHWLAIALGLVVAAAWAQGCGSSDDSECAVGSEGCPCTGGGGCDPGLTCASDVCVDLGDDAGVDGGASSDAGDPGDAGTATDGGTDAGPPVCGDGTVNGDEECDDTPVANGSCDACSITCDTGYGDCNAEPVDGCESHFQSDPYNCGGCDAECDPGQICVSGSCDATVVTKLLVADEQGTVLDVTRDGQYVYWSGSDSSGPYLRRWLHAGGGSAEDVSSAEGDGFGMLAVDSSHVYGAACDGDRADEIYRVPKDGGSPTLVHSVDGHIPCGTGIAVDGDSVVFAAIETTGIGMIPTLKVRSVPKGGGSAVELLSESFLQPLDLDGVDPVYVGVAEAAGATRGVISIDGSGSTEIASATSFPTRVALFGDHVYFIDGDLETDALGSVRRVSATGGAVETLATGQMNPSDVAVFDGTVYWTNEGRVGDSADDGQVVSAPVGGGSIEYIASGEARPQHLVVTDDEVVWVNRSGGDATIVATGI